MRSWVKLELFRHGCTLSLCSWDGFMGLFGLLKPLFSRIACGAYQNCSIPVQSAKSATFSPVGFGQVAAIARLLR